MIYYGLKEQGLTNFKLKNKYALGTEFVTEKGKKGKGDIEVRYFTLQDEKGKTRRFTSREFYHYFECRGKD